MIQFACPTCSTTLRTDDAYAGRKVVCPRCNQQVSVPPPVTRTIPGQPREDEATVIPPLSLDELHRPPPPPREPPPPPPEPRSPPRQEDPIPPRIPAREYDDYDEDEPRPRRSRRRGDEEDDYEDDRRTRRRRPIDRGDAGGPGPGGAAVTGLVLSCIGAFFALAAPLSCGATLHLGLPLSVAGLVTSLCGRQSAVRILGIIFGAVGIALSLLVLSAFNAAINRRF